MCEHADLGHSSPLHATCAQSPVNDLALHCIHGQADAANQRTTDALGTQDSHPDPGDEGDGDSEQAC